DRVLEQRVRRHGNLAENAALMLAGIALLELLSGQTLTVTLLAFGFAVARLAHAIGFSSLAGSHGENLSGGRKVFALFRIVGAFGTALTGFGAAIAILIALA
ncbi:MAG: MAPEG family protein, partial [Pseudomonadota bacterium]